MPIDLILASEFASGIEKIKKLLGDRTGQKVAFVPTAAYGEGFEPERERALLGQLCPQVKDVDLTGKSEAEITLALADVDLLFVCGGNTFYLLQQMQACGFRRVLDRCFSRGVIYLGSSAGSIVCSPDVAFVKPMDDPAKASLKSTEGLGLIDFLFLPHLDHPTLGEEKCHIAATYQGPTPMLALHDDQIAHVVGRVVTLY